MKLWEIKARALRIMFADSDMSYTEEDFKDGTLYDNANTRDKLIGMDESIRRAIDTYYIYCGNIRKKKIIKYVEDTNILDISDIEHFGKPERIDLVIDLETEKVVQEFLSFHYNEIDKEIEVKFDNVSRSRLNDLHFVLYYEVERLNLPFEYDKHDFNLDEIFIPIDVQRMIPHFIKGELYEEDEAAIAFRSMNEYLVFLHSRPNHYTTAQQKVKSRFIRG